VGQLVAAAGGTSFSTSLPLASVPAGFYQIIVGYRPTLGGGAWTSWATSYGFVFSVNSPAVPAMTITAPAGQDSYVSGNTFTATWTTDLAVSTGQFAVWVRSADGGTWYWMAPLVPANGTTSYSAPINLTGVAPGLGYQVIVAYEPISYTSLWAGWATSPGVFSVDAVAPTITVNATGAAYTTAQSVDVTWTTNQTLAGGEFGLWVRSGSGGWYVTTLVPAAGSAGTPYSTALPLASVPVGSGNQVIIAYRPVAGTGGFMSWATSPGSFTLSTP